MMRYGLLVTTVITAVLTGAVLYRAGWCSGAARAAALRDLVRKREAVSARPHPASTSAAYHYRHGTPKHWHDCLLQH
jgi:hypothetical protein